MSNLIKYPFVNLQGKEARVIQYDDQQKFVPLNQKKKTVKMSLEEAAEEKALRMMEEAAEPAEEEFAAGIPVANFDEMFHQKEAEAEREARTIVDSARETAEQILAEAREQVDTLREEARQEGIASGREEGLSLAQDELEQAEAELIARKKQQEQEFETMVQEMERHYVEILCSLIRKLTGVIMSDQKDVLLHLIRSGIADMEPAKHYTIRACTGDLFYIESNKNDILEQMGITGSLEVQEEKGLASGECIIETDTQMIDCGFQTQLDNLIRTLRMLVQ